MTRHFPESIRISVFALVLTGCATDALKPAPDVVSAAPATQTVTVSCVKDVPAAPKLYADAEWAHSPADPNQRAIALKADRRALMKYAEQLENALAACKTP